MRYEDLKFEEARIREEENSQIFEYWHKNTNIHVRSSEHHFSILSPSFLCIINFIETLYKKKILLLKSNLPLTKKNSFAYNLESTLSKLLSMSIVMRELNGEERKKERIGEDGGNFPIIAVFTRVL